MGTEAIWVPLVTAAVAAGTSYYNSNQTAKRQDRAAADAIRNQRAIQDEANAKVNRTLQDVQASSPAEERKTAEDAYLQQVKNAQSLARANLDEDGVSSAYDEAAGKAGNQAQGYAQQIAGLMARMDAPINQRTNEGFSFGNLTSDLGGVQRKSAGQQWIDQLKAATIRRNPWLDAAASAMSAYGSSYGAGGASGGAASAGAGGSGMGGGMYSTIMAGV